MTYERLLTFSEMLRRSARPRQLLLYTTSLSTHKLHQILRVDINYLPAFTGGGGKCKEIRKVAIKTSPPKKNKAVTGSSCCDAA